MMAHFFFRGDQSICKNYETFAFALGENFPLWYVHVIYTNIFRGRAGGRLANYNASIMEFFKFWAYGCACEITSKA